MANFDLGALSGASVTDAIWTVPSQINRNHTNPLDESTLFYSYDEACRYALSSITRTKGGKTVTIQNAYPGQFIAVATDAGVSGYVINVDRTLTQVATGGDAAELARKLEELSGSLLSSDGIIDKLSGAIDANAAGISEISATIPNLSNALSAGLSVTVEELATPIGDNATTYVVKQGGLSVGDYINIPKDKVFESAYMVAVTGEPGSATTDTISAFTVKYDTVTAHVLSDDTGTKSDDPSLTAFAEGTFASIKNAYFGKEGGDGPYLRITVSHQDVPVYIAMPKLVDTYYGATTDTVKVEISPAHEISASVLAGSIGTAHLSADAVTNAKIADDAVQTENIKDGNVTTAKIADDAVTNDKIAADAVATAQLSSQAVTTAKIADTAVTSDKLAADSVVTAKIADGNVTTAKIADANVTAAKLAADSVETAKIKDGNVTTAKIADSNVTTAKIADGNVTTTKIADNAVTEAKLSADSVTTGKIKDAAVTKAKLANDVLTWGESLSAQALTDAKSYTDGVSATLSTDFTTIVNTARTDLSSYARETSANALSEAKSYTDSLSTVMDGKISTARTDLSSYARETSANALTEAKSYADSISTALTGIYETKTDAAAQYTALCGYTDSLSTAMDGKISTARTDLSSYARETSANALAEAKSYTNAEITKLSATQTALSSNETLSTHIESNGVVTVTKQKIQIDESQVNGLVSDLGSKLDAATFSTISNDIGLSAASSANKVVTQTDIKDIVGVMHFRGVTTTDLSTGLSVIPAGTGYYSETPPYEKVPTAGDMVINATTTKEFVWAGEKWLSSGTTGKWYELGKEGIYVTEAEFNSWKTDTLEPRLTSIEGDVSTVSTDLGTLSTDFGNAKTSLEAADSYISGKVDNKVKIGTGSFAEGATAPTYNVTSNDLSVVKISDEDYYRLVSTGKQDNDVLYIVSSDYVNGHDLRVINVGNAISATDAVNLSTLQLSVDNIQQQYADEKILSVKINDTVFELTAANNVASISVESINCGGAN